jgi:hypothetical protein
MADKVKKDTKAVPETQKQAETAITVDASAVDAGSNTADSETATDGTGTGGDDGDGSDDDADATGDIVSDALISPETVTDAEIGTVVPAGETVERLAVVFLGPHHRYSRGDTACFDAEQSQQLVARGIAVWPKDAKRALSTRPGANEHDTDIG